MQFSVNMVFGIWWVSGLVPKVFLPWGEKKMMWWHPQFFHIMWNTPSVFILSSAFCEQTQSALTNRYKNTLLALIKSIMRHSKSTGHSLKVCTKTQMVLLFDSVLFPHIWLSKLLNSRKAEFLKYLEKIWSWHFNWSLALSCDCAGFTGLTDRASVLASRILSDKWTVLAEFSSAIRILNQAVSADAVPDHIIAVHEAQAAALQWLLFAVTAIRNNKDGCPGSVIQCINNHVQRIWQTYRNNTRGSEKVFLTPTMSHKTNTHTHTSLHSACRLLNALLL